MDENKFVKEDVFTEPTMLTVTDTESEKPEAITIMPENNSRKIKPCPNPKPCCEACNPNHTEVTVKPCTDYVEKTVDVVVDPKGKILAVNLNLPLVCNTKDINVGVFVTEVVLGQEKPCAHKVIRIPATKSGPGGSCQDNRDCHCVEFMINDNADTVCKERKFRIRTKAHYVDTATDGPQRCSCQCNIRPC